MGNRGFSQERWFLIGAAVLAVGTCFVFRWAHPIDVAITEVKWNLLIGHDKQVADHIAGVAERIKYRPTACVHYGWIFAKKGRTDAAETLFRAAADANPFDPVGAEALAGLYFSQQRLDDVRRVFVRTSALGTALTAEGLRMHASMQIVDGQYAEASKTLLELTSKETPSAEMLAKLGDLAAWQKNFNEAIVYYRQARELTPDDLELRIRLTHALAWAALGDARAALEHPKLAAAR